VWRLANEPRLPWRNNHFLTIECAYTGGTMLLPEREHLSTSNAAIA